MDLASIVDNEAIHELELLSPKDNSPTGVVWGIRSFESDEVEAAVRQGTNNMLKRRSPAGMTANELEQDELAKVVASVAWWKWNGHELHGVKDPEFTPDNIEKALRIGWIFEQVKGASVDRENFIKGSPKPPRKTSQSKPDTTG